MNESPLLNNSTSSSVSSVPFENETQIGNSSLFWNCMYASSLSTFHIFYIIFFGFLFRKLGFMDDKFEAAFSKIIGNLLLPSLIFIEIVTNFDVTNIQLIYEVVLGCLTINIIGLLFGILASVLIGSDGNETAFIMGVMSAPDTTSYSIVLVEVLAPVLDKFEYTNLPVSGVKLSGRSRGLMYIILNTIIENFWRWSVSFNLINQSEQEKELDDAYFKENYIELEQQAPEGQYEPQSSARKSLTSEGKGKIQKRFKKKEESSGYKHCYMLLGIFNVPIIVSILSIFICYTDGLRVIFTSPTSLAHQTIFSVSKLVSSSYATMVILDLGLNFGSLECCGSEKSENTFGCRKVTIITFLKLFLMPLVGVPIFYMYDYFGWVMDKLLLFLFLFMVSAPNAINLIIVCGIKNTKKKELSLVMIAQYLVSIVSLTILIAYYLYILL